MKRIFTPLWFAKNAVLKNTKLEVLQELPSSPEVGQICIYNEDNTPKFFIYNGYYWHSFTSEELEIAGIQLNNNITDDALLKALSLYKMELVQGLPQNPSDDTLYLIPEE